MEKKVNQQGTISEKKWHFKRAFCRIIGEPGIHGIAFGFLWCWGVFGSLSHFRQSSGAVPPWALYRWAHVWRNEPRAIILSFSFFPPSVSLCLSTSPCFLFTSFCFPSPRSPLSHVCPFIFSTSHYHPPTLHASFSSLLFSIALPSPPSIPTPFFPPVVTVSWGCKVSFPCSGSRKTRQEARRNELTETQEHISGLCYRKIYPFTLCRAARRADGGRVMGRCCRRST